MVTNPCKPPRVRAFLSSAYLNVCFASSTSQCRLWSLQTSFVFNLLWLHWFLAIISEVPTTVLPQILCTWHNLTWGTLFLVDFMVYLLRFFKAFKVSSSWGLLWLIFKIITNSFPFSLIFLSHFIVLGSFSYVLIYACFIWQLEIFCIWKAMTLMPQIAPNS